MTRVRNLAYIGFGASDLDSWRRFATDILGMQVVEPGPDDGSVLLLRMDERAYRLAVHEGTDAALHHLGFEVGSVAELDALTDHLEQNGVSVAVADPEICARRRVSSLRLADDPFGNRLELFVGAEQASTPFVSPTGARFVTGDMGLGHAFLWVDDVQRFFRFYTEVLGFRLSDTLAVAPGNDGYFLHCNPRHHTLAGMAVEGMPLGLGHIMVEVDDVDVVGLAYDKVIKAGIPVPGTIGRHANDLMLSFYAQTPSTFPIEYGTQGRLVDDDTWTPSHHLKASIWGHARPSDPRP